MRGPSPKTLIAAVSLGAVIGVAIVDLERTAPGPLHLAHARVDELSGPDSCSTCHGGWTSSMTESCLDCHDAIQHDVEKRTGLHGFLDPTVSAQCASCHSEHHGAEFQSVNDLSFARAGIAERLEFEHRSVGFAMDGVHLEQECSACHEHADAVVVPEGAHRYLGLDSGCVACHEDPHDGTLTVLCAECHTQNTFEEHRFVGHDAFLPLVGPHGALDCRECHADGESHALEPLRGPRAERPLARDCRACHDQPHDEAFVEYAASQAGVDAPLALRGKEANRLCADCHEPEHATFAVAAEDLTPAEHLASGFPLIAPHADLDCTSCHDAGGTFEERFPGRRNADCAACHEDPHAGQFAGSVFDAIAEATVGPFPGGAVDGRGCLVCHVRAHFEPSRFGVEAHAQTALPLTGAHVTTDCNACHAEDARGVRLFADTAHTCDACHDDAHDGYFGARFAEASELPPPPAHGDCERCHDPRSFTVSDPDRFDHAFWTGFELTGSHLAAECTACHTRAAAPDDAGRTFGRIEESYGAIDGCADCHEDVHGGRFDREAHLAEIDGRSDCARCHTTDSFRGVSDAFDHGRWTGWKLEDAHAEASCTACHAPLRRPDADGRTWGHALGSDCASCHQSPHGTQFDRSDEFSAKSCERCHESAASFTELAFDHDIESRFPLDEAHEQVACGECHAAPETGGPVVWRPLTRECVDCHGVHEKALRKRWRRRK